MSVVRWACTKVRMASGIEPSPFGTERDRQVRLPELLGREVSEEIDPQSRVPHLSSQRRARVELPYPKFPRRSS
jgi:hypothetical protein